MERLPHCKIFQIALVQLIHDPVPALCIGFEREPNIFPAADAQGDDAPFETITAHRMDKAGGEHGLCCTDRVATGDGAAFDIDDVLGQPEKVSGSITRMAAPSKVTHL